MGKFKEAATQETSELLLAAKETDAMVENMNADFDRESKRVDICIGEVTFPIGILTQHQLATDKETQFLHEA